MATLGERIEAALEWKKWSQADLLREGKRLDYGIGSSMLSKWIRDKASPSANQIISICRLLGISAHWLLLEEGDMAAPGKAAVDPYIQARIEISAELRRGVREGLEGALTARAGVQRAPDVGERPKIEKDVLKVMPKKVAEPRVLPLARKAPRKGKG